MCATVCPSGALFYGTEQEIEIMRPRSRPMNEFHFGRQQITTRVRMMVPTATPPNHLDVVGAMEGGRPEARVELPVISTDAMMLGGLYDSQAENEDHTT